jgi:hypothetical protein
VVVGAAAFGCGAPLGAGARVPATLEIGLDATHFVYFIKYIIHKYKSGEYEEREREDGMVQKKVTDSKKQRRNTYMLLTWHRRH